MSSIAKFWLVWSENGRAPTRKHWTKQSAQEEAARLSTVQPGRTFIVLAAVDAVRAEINPPKSVRVVKREPSQDEEIPF